MRRPTLTTIHCHSDPAPHTGGQAVLDQAFMQPIILDQFGRPAQSTGKQWYKGPGDSSFRQTAPRLDADIRAMLDQYKHRVMISDARNIVKSYSNLAGAVAQKAGMV
jgi:hypothetical protein